MRSVAKSVHLLSYVYGIVADVCEQEREARRKRAEEVVAKHKAESEAASGSVTKPTEPLTPFRFGVFNPITNAAQYRQAMDTYRDSVVS